MEPTTARLAMAGAQFIVANCGSDEVARMCNLAISSLAHLVALQ